MDRNEFAAKLYHLRPANSGLQPLAMMKLRIPVVDWGMVPAEGDFEVVVLLKADDTALNLDVEAGSWGRTDSSVSAGGQTQFAKNSHFLREIGVEVQDELTLVKSTSGT